MRIYDEILVPAVFIPWAENLVQSIDPEPGCHALDVACGPGSVTRVLARSIGPKGKVTGADISPAMLGIARSKATQGDSAPIEWVESPAAPLAVSDESFDVLTCQQGLQFFPDKLAALSEMRRALRTGGKGAVSFWTQIEEQPMFRALRDGIAETVSAELAGRYGGPWSLAGEEAREMATRAGFGDVRLERVELALDLPGGAKAVVATLGASGIAADIAALEETVHREMEASVAKHLEPILEGGAVKSTLTSWVMFLR